MRSSDARSLIWEISGGMLLGELLRMKRVELHPDDYLPSAPPPDILERYGIAIVGCDSFGDSRIGISFCCGGHGHGIACASAVDANRSLARAQRITLALALESTS